MNNISSLRFMSDFQQVAILGRYNMLLPIVVLPRGVSCSGSFGSVVSVKHSVDGRCYAVKIVSLAADEQTKTKTLREVYALSRWLQRTPE